MIHKALKGIVAALIGYATIEGFISSTNLIDVLIAARNYTSFLSVYKEKHDFFFNRQKPDPILGFIDRSHPEMDIDSRDYRDELGLRNTPFHKEYAQIAVVGDSFAYGEGVTIKESWFKRLEFLVETTISNFGVNAYSLWQYNAVMRKWGDYFRDRVLLYCIYTNDFAFESPAIANDYYQKSGRIKYNYSDPSFLDLVASAPQKKFLERTLTYNLLKFLFIGRDTTKTRDGYLIKGENQMKEEMVSPENFERIKQLFNDAKELSDSFDAKLIVVLFPSRAKIYTENYQTAFPEDRSLSLEEIAFEFSKHHFSELGVPVFDLTVILQRERLKGKIYFNFDAHFNSRGNYIVAKSISCYLAENGYVEPTQSITDLCWGSTETSTTEF